MIRLGENIRTLRLRDGRTQETLAGALGVTAQAVSRWEKGICYPDMEMIAPLANYFGVSIDELFGYDNERGKKVEALAEKIREMNRQNNGEDVCLDACIALAREALIEFPGNETLTLALASVLINAGYVRRGEHHIDGGDGFSVYDTERHKTYPEWREAIKLYEKLLLSLPAGAAREQAVTELAQLYKNTGEHEKALLLAESAPELTASRPFLRIRAFDGREAVAACGEALLETVQKSAELIVQIVLADRTIAPQDAAVFLQNAEGFYAAICPDRRWGRNSGLLACLQMLRSYYLWLAGDRDAAFAALDSALAHAADLDTLPNTSGEYFSSPLLRHVRIRAEKVPENSAFRKELPELWPWWDVPEYDRVQAELQADPRWADWVRRTQE
ncbi:MAG: helix-turn-helix domain-containing protein [Lachnospiraceae bacterium]|nr:helix-turn-helix domain-containing protein [Lachnospiraceae bacterium]